MNFKINYIIVRTQVLTIMNMRFSNQLNVYELFCSFCILPLLRKFKKSIIHSDFSKDFSKNYFKLINK